MTCDGDRINYKMYLKSRGIKFSVITPYIYSNELYDNNSNKNPIVKTLELHWHDINMHVLR
jgi:hypothetical protein